MAIEPGKTGLCCCGGASALTLPDPVEAKTGLHEREKN